MRQAARLFRQRPLGFLIQAATVALAVGAGSAVFSVTDAMLIRPLPFPRGHELAQIYLLPPGVTDPAVANPLHPLDLVRLRERLTVADGPAGIVSSERALGGTSDPESVSTAAVSFDFFSLLGVAPLHGRAFTEAEDVAGAAVAIISHRLWQNRFGGRPDIVGTRIEIDRTLHEIVGVMPASFEPAYVPAEIWTPLGIHGGNLPRRNATFIQNVLRLRPAGTLVQLAVEVEAVMAAAADEAPDVLNGWTSHVRTLRNATYGTQRVPLLLLLGGVLALVLIAVSNLTNLAIARFAARRGELALRQALGASGRDLIRAELAGALLVAAAGGGAGALLAAVALPLIVNLNPLGRLPADAALIDWRVAAGTVGLSVVTALGPPAASMLRLTRRADAAWLATGSPRLAPGASGLQFAMAAGQIALAMVLLTSAALLFAGFEQTARVDVGFDAEGVLATQLRLSDAAYGSADARVALLDRTLEAVRARPGVLEAASTMNLLIPGFAYITLIETGDPPAPGAMGHTVQFRRISERYFRTMGTPIVSGRDFDPRDRDGSELVAIVSRSFAARFWPEQSPLGRRIRRGLGFSTVLTVVGVAGDVRDVDVGREPQPTLYLPYRQNNNTTTPISLVVRTAGDPSAIAAPVAQAVWSVDPAQPLSRTMPMTRFLDDSLGPQRFRSVLLAVFAGIGLLLSALGVVGVTARSGIERRREIGVRTALGGLPAAIWWQVARRPLGAVAAGSAAGIAVAFAVAQVLAAQLTEVAQLSTSTGWPGALLLVIVGVAAAGLPSYRATRIDPVLVLRTE